MSKSWFEVDAEGLARLVADRGKVFILHELIQNALDADDVHVITIDLRPVALSPKVRLIITDDSPNGFCNLTEAWTLFADSQKKSKADKRGRFNLGEKLVLALCEEAKLITVTGGVRFDASGRHNLRERTESGTRFDATLRATRAEFEEMCREVWKIIVPPGLRITFNDKPMVCRNPILQFENTLPTVLADAEGVLRRTERNTKVLVYEPLAGEKASIYEMGIPVVETGDRFHVDVQQKVPLNSDRDNVTPGFLRTLRVAVVNHTTHLIDVERAASTEVQEATSDPRASTAAMDIMLTERFGARRFTFDPSDPEANARLTGEGYVAIQGGSLNKEQWNNVKQHGLSQPAGELAPTPKPYCPGGHPENIIPRDNWTEGMRRIAAFYSDLARAILKNPHNWFDVKIVREPGVSWAANYGPGGPLTMNVSKLGHQFFDEFPGNAEHVLDLFIHELGHHFAVNHLSDDYYRALTQLGARITMLALTDPGLFHRHGINHSAGAVVLAQ